ncbi:hypothetical protein B0A52_01749 [Exophiala mesophila]|uniref:NAD(P)-binding protein n=1 Tax=Exophiala mesophila TaxID=212818 RepID=A0A438NFX1_EXOME|nr:hypothetical protein B0A52_01749 [Exophiala mesophila]
MASIDDLYYTHPFQITKQIRRDVYEYISPSNASNKQAGKIIVITGGGTGIGASISRIWIQAGAEGVVIAGRRKDVLDKTVQDLKGIATADTKVLGVQADVVQESDMKDLFETVKTTFGRTADVVVANAGYVPPSTLVAEQDISIWWQGYEVNVKGLHNTAVQWIRSQQNPKEPQGTFISVSSALGGFAFPGGSSYGSSKLAGHRYVEYLGLEYPKIRTFITIPGIVATEALEEWLLPYAKDSVELTGALSLYLSTNRADFLKSSLISVNWDIETLERHQDEVQRGALKLRWVEQLPRTAGDEKGTLWE